MADILEQLKAYIDSEVTGWRVTEQMPSNVNEPYIWLDKSGETERDRELTRPRRIGQTFYTAEIVSPNLESVRDTTEQLKKAFRALDKFPPEFDPEVEKWNVTDIDNDYIFRSIPQDSRLERGALSLTAHHA